MRNIARRVIVRGMVTGVGFRYSTVGRAEQYGDLKGYVRNVDERTVECVLQGPKEQVEDMVAWLQRGPSSARVTEHHVAELPVDDSRPAFQVRY